MARVRVSGGRLYFSVDFMYEMKALSGGPESARAELRDMASREIDAETRRALLDVCEIPLILTTSLEEKYERFYALVREMGEAVQEEFGRNRSPKDLETLFGAYLKGFGSSIMLEDVVFFGLSDLFYQCGKITAGMTETIYPENEKEAKPDLGEIRAAFERGVIEKRS